ncbi:MAG: gfo/Idh/MocA family oxidoreductase, partial [Planctomycetaceae bacterium]|nr:gfo/Idh/MocA family oxidoreductase [Planctomycetaceae bacterium]
LKAELEDFIGSVSTGRAPEVTGEDAVRAISLAQEILKECKDYIDRYGMLERLWGST